MLSMLYPAGNAVPVAPPKSPTLNGVESLYLSELTTCVHGRAKARKRELRYEPHRRDCLNRSVELNQYQLAAIAETLRLATGSLRQALALLNERSDGPWSHSNAQNRQVSIWVIHHVLNLPITCLAKVFIRERSGIHRNIARLESQPHLLARAQRVQAELERWLQIHYSC